MTRSRFKCPCCNEPLEMTVHTQSVTIWCGHRSGRCTSYRANDGAEGRDEDHAFGLLRDKIFDEDREREQQRRDLDDPPPLHL